ncbi:DNA replication and repair protein RecF [Natronincola peptidivorans]|uniref:DNA replication and repair protein RecF n=1 Tax=Natronincola peptidivorans TaxID=426128 RepID=A0A1I0GPV4_9FIRM|nr:DNA replication/repair protein RecF [Natronincola peptidivorans]SET72290.1 DNA replication and repair protein RecF [Natronincola peptidivorans]
MIVEELKLINQRNYKELQLQFHPKLNVIVGENAQGKTNILEAIYVGAIGKSFRTNKDQEMIKMLKENAYIKVKVRKITDKVEIEILLSKEVNKKIKINKVPLIKYGDLLGNLNVVLFSPEDLKIIKEGPNERRRFINNDISQISPKYYYTLTQYNKILQQRNKLLKNYKGNKINIEIWNEQLTNQGASLMIYRRNFIKRIAILAKLMHRKITEGSESLEVQYESNVKVKDDEELKDIKVNFLKKLKELQDVEIRRGLTLVGPHRDDLIFKINGLEVKNFGSQGQQRTSVLSLKLAELELMKGEVGEYPILLLDDVMSELDAKRQNYLIHNLKNIQTFITTTNIEPLNINNDKEYTLFEVVNGEISIISPKK